MLKFGQDRETEPRFVGPPTRGDFGNGGGTRGNFHGGPPGGAGGYGNQMGGPQGGDGRQLYISNVCSLPPEFPETHVHN